MENRGKHHCPSALIIPNDQQPEDSQSKTHSPKTAFGLLPAIPAAKGHSEGQSAQSSARQSPERSSWPLSQFARTPRRPSANLFTTAMNKRPTAPRSDQNSPVPSKCELRQSSVQRKRVSLKTPRGCPDFVDRLCPISPMRSVLYHIPLRDVDSPGVPDPLTVDKVVDRTCSMPEIPHHLCVENAEVDERIQSCPDIIDKRLVVEDARSSLDNDSEAEDDPNYDASHCIAKPLPQDSRKSSVDSTMMELAEVSPNTESTWSTFASPATSSTSAHEEIVARPEVQKSVMEASDGRLKDGVVCEKRVSSFITERRRSSTKFMDALIDSDNAVADVVGKSNIAAPEAPDTLEAPRKSLRALVSGYMCAGRIRALGAQKNDS